MESDSLKLKPMLKIAHSNRPEYIISRIPVKHKHVTVLISWTGK